MRTKRENAAERRANTHRHEHDVEFHHDTAAHHHREAAEQRDAGDHDTADLHASMARHHAQRADEHEHALRDQIADSERGDEAQWNRDARGFGDEDSERRLARTRREERPQRHTQRDRN